MRTMKNFKTSLEPLQLLNLLIQLLPCHEGQAENTKGPTVLDNSADEDSEKGDEESAQSRDSERTLSLRSDK